MKKIALALLLGIALVPAASYAQVHIVVAPPAVVIEHPGPPPQAGFVWVAGYHRWEGDHYVWTPGRWDRPPHPGAHWVAHRWVHRHGEWILIEGHWR